MELFKIDQQMTQSLLAALQEKECNLSSNDLTAIIDQIKEGVLSHYVHLLISQIENILDISPSLSEREILQKVARSVVEFLGAEAATLRIYDPFQERLIVFGSFPDSETERKEAISLEDTIAGEVLKSHQCYLVPDIGKEPKYSETKKQKMADKGVHSMLAIPISLSSFSQKGVDTEGVLQIYFKEEDKNFTLLETKIAETFARRVSYVIARKRILNLQEVNTIKEKIFEQIFLKLGRREGVKMKELFNLVIPEVAEIMRIQRCALFSVMEDRQNVILEAGFPEEQHGIGKILSVKEPYIDAVLNSKGPYGEFEDEKIYPNYIHIHNPENSRLLTPALRKFLKLQEIHSVLYIPLKVEDETKYFLVFDAQSHHRRFTDEKIEIFTFLGKELMKGLRLEKMDDILHDFKNPAIAVSGFARRVRKYLEDGDYLGKREKIDQALEIIQQEAARIQELGLTLYEEGRETALDLSEVLLKRFRINEETVRELKRSNIHLEVKGLENPLPIRGNVLMVERIMDNLLNNASKAIPETGGDLCVRSYRKECWAVAEISNTGEIPAEDRERYLQGEGKGRGLHITGRLVKRLGGQIDLESQSGMTTFRILLPFSAEPQAIAAVAPIPH
ncbi:MAG: sensor histidine kinase [Deltaproteobacteria bacterium]|nr:sensor histidine kinase [Deltaproteobacteria bacterium]